MFNANELLLRERMKEYEREAQRERLVQAVRADAKQKEVVQLERDTNGRWTVPAAQPLTTQEQEAIDAEAE